MKINLWRIFGLIIFLVFIAFFSSCEVHSPQTEQQMRQLRQEAKQRHLERTVHLNKMEGQIAALQEANEITLLVFCVAFALFFVPVLVVMVFLAKRYLELQQLFLAGENAERLDLPSYMTKKRLGKARVVASNRY